MAINSPSQRSHPQRPPSTTAVITLSREGARVASQIAAALGADRFIHAAATTGRLRQPTTRFNRVTTLTRRIFSRYRALIYVMPCGVVVRAIAPCLRSKLTDPAVVVVDVGARHAISLLSGHEGGANELAFQIANCTGAEPVISTTTEAVKALVVGVGCRRGVPAVKIIAAIRTTLRRRRLNLRQVRLLASADVKADEPGLHTAAQRLGLPLRFIPSAEIQATRRHFTRSRFVEKKVDLPAVAEPAALLAGQHTQLICPKQIFDGVTVAVARETFR